MPRKSENSFAWLAKYLSLALTLPASVFAGYIVARVAQHWFKVDWLPVVGVVLGMASGLMQIIRQLSRDSK